MAYVPEIGEVGYAIDMEKLKTYSFEIGAMRPPSEGGSFSLSNPGKLKIIPHPFTKLAN